MPGTFSYTESTNTIEVTDGTEGAPATFNDMLHADRTVATTACSVNSGAELKAATAIANPTDVTLTYPMRPVNEKALRLAITTAANGGAAASGDETVDVYGTTCVWHYLSGASANGQKVVPIANNTHNYQVGDTVILIDISNPSTYETDTIASISEGVSITMTNNNTNAYAAGDVVGIYQTEQIDTSAAHGTFWTTVPYGQIAKMTFTGYDGTNTAKVDQPIWGVVWEYVADGQYKIDCIVTIGDGSTATYFQSKNEEVYFSDGMYITVEDNASLEIGDLYESYPVDGSMWSFGLTGGTLTVIAYGDDDANFYCYGSRIHNRENNKYYFRTGNEVKFVDSILSYESQNTSAKYEFREPISTLVFDRVHFYNMYAPVFYSTPDTFTNVYMHRQYYGLITGTSTTGTIINPKMTSLSTDLFTGASATLTIQDYAESWSDVSIYNGDADSITIAEYTCNIHVANSSGEDLGGVYVDCEYAHLVEGSDSKTYKCIQDHTAVDATHKPITGTDWGDYWELYSDTGGYGDWNTGFAYKSGTAEWTASSVQTDSDGDITEQNITVRRWTTTSETEEARIHKFTFTYGGDTEIFDEFLIDAPIKWHLEFPPVATMLTAIYNKLPSKDYLAGSADSDGGFDSEAKADIGDSVWDESATDHVTANTMGERIDEIRNDVTSIGLTGSAVGVTADSCTVTTGTEANDYTSTYTINETYHQITAVGGVIDFYYEFDIGTEGTPVSATAKGRVDEGSVPSGGDTCYWYAYDWDASDWVSIGSKDGIANSDSDDDLLLVVPLFSQHVGTGANDGKVHIRFGGTGLEANTAILIDHVNVQYANVISNPSIADAVWDEESTGHTDAGKAGQQMWTDVDSTLSKIKRLGATGEG